MRKSPHEREQPADGRVCAHVVSRTVALVAAVLVVTAACSAERAAEPPSASARVSSPAAATSPATAATPTTASAPPSPGTSIPGQCSNPHGTTRAVIERYFQLSTSGDARAVSDCFANSWRASSANFEDASARWASAGPVLSLQSDLVDQAKGCDRYRVIAELANGARVSWSGPKLQFYAVGPDGTTPRVFETSTALVRADLATTMCQ